MEAGGEYCKWCGGWPCGRVYAHNLREYWKEHVAHGFVGLAAGVLLITGYHWAGIAIMATVWVRQGLEYHKRKDTPGIDLAYHLGGLLVGVAVAVVSVEIG